MNSMATSGHTATWPVVSLTFPVSNTFFSFLKVTQTSLLIGKKIAQPPLCEKIAHLA